MSAPSPLERRRSRSSRRFPNAIAATLAAAAAAAPLAAEVRVEGDLARRAELGFSTREGAGRLPVGPVDTASPAGRAGLREGDLLAAIDGRAFGAPHVGADLLRRVDGDRPVTLTIERDGRASEVRFTPAALPFEQIEGLDTTYGVVTTRDGARLRTVVTRPRESHGPLPAIFLTQWVSCDGVEPLGESAWDHLIRSIATRSGAALVRVERSSGGDSEGPGCHELDYETELAHYRDAFDALAGRADIDRRRIVVFGMSLGSTTAPLLAAEREVAGIAVSGGGALTYFERMLAFDRLGFERGGTPPTEIDARMRRHAAFLVRYLLAGEDPAEIARQRPELSDVWRAMRGTGDGVHYGRPYAWHRQLARRDLLAAWSRIAAPALVVYGEYDQFEPPHAHRAAVEMLERLRPGQARAVEIPGMSHFYEVHPTAVDAALGRNGEAADELAAGAVLNWLHEAVGIAPAAAD